MNIQMFLDILGDKLHLLGVDDKNISKHLYMFERYLNSLDADELEETFADEEQINIIAVNIYKLIQKKSSRGTPEQPPDSYSVSATDSSESNYPNDSDSDDTDNASFAEDADDDDMQIYENKPESDETETIPPESDDSDVRIYDSTGDTKVIDAVSPYSGDTALTPNFDENAGTKIINKVKPAIVSDNTEVPEINFDEYDDFVEDVHASPTFWLIFFLTLPITLALLCVILTLFVSLFAAVAVTIVGLITALIGIIVVGTGLSLVGIIYGITQTFNALPIGLYEIGLGVLIGGVAMLCGILVYNCAVRLLPFVIKQLVKLLVFVLERIKYLFNHLKRESAKK